MRTDQTPSSRQGDRLFDAGQFAVAKAKYMGDAQELVGAAFTLPSERMISDAYIALNPYERTNMMGCCVGIAKCLRRENEIEMALAWCEEVNAIYRCGYYAAPHPLYDWFDHLDNLPEMTLVKSAALCLASEIFAELGNSGTATTRRWNAHKTTKSAPMPHQTPALHSILDRALRERMLKSRHPDPQAPLGKGGCVSGLQLRGSWARLNVGRLGGVTSGRENFASFIWNSHLYVAGGRTSSTGPFHRDMWTLDLHNPDGWRQLPDYPSKFGRAGTFVGWNMLVHNDTALLFTGRPTIGVFDLASETWSSFETTYAATAADVRAGVTDGWPYPGRHCADATTQIVDGTLYVFGGAHSGTIMGCNLFMALDLATRAWRRLSGSVRPPKDGDYTCPGPRKSAASWASPDKTRLYLLYGHFDREAAARGELHGAGEAFGYEDFWSWGIKEECWRRERMAGNPPCARTELSYTYNEKLGKAIVFGGYHPTLPTTVLAKGTETQYSFSYFADTFICDMGGAVPQWQQVLTPGFPTYRCQAQLLCDSATGRTYMFGGWTNAQYIPTRTKLLTRSFGDVWELRVDLPGGQYDAAGAAEEARVAPAGPWQRCFVCGSAGPWKKCGGSCTGRVFFCGAPCLREGWKEHKELHRCRKV
ncbi:hypothetical protein B0H15DRAFT_580440 [Mycena belliarum]|uniref:Uncharacterized protein n=1 Tax=Mycena belliarum TaxID=1033014 RepID=A0AAD6UEI2_9AGAR|nr:hypothetical protein B0H15DRAFT_580440 [Mycena belliae]